MNCANHVDVPATAYCRTCGKPVCASCARDVRGVIYCEDCLASQVSGTMPPPPPVGTVAPGTTPAGGSPGLALALGFIPGVGAMYNGEYAKGFVHALIFATLIWATSNVSEFFGPIIGIFVIYMVIEAYQTAKARRLGLQPPDPFGLNSWLSSRATIPAPQPAPQAGAAIGAPIASAAPLPVEAPANEQNVPVGAYVLIGLGVLFLLNTFGWFHIGWLFHQFWPLILIALGVFALVKRTRTGY